MTTSAKFSDAERRQLIVQQAVDTPISPRGKCLDLKISMHSNGTMFIGTKGAKDISCSNDMVGVTELTKLLELLRREQLKREGVVARSHRMGSTTYTSCDR